MTLLAEALRPEELAAVCKSICLKLAKQYFQAVMPNGEAKFDAIVKRLNFETLRAEEASLIAQDPAKALMLFLRLAAKEPDLMTELADELVQPCLRDALDRMFRGQEKPDELHRELASDNTAADIRLKVEEMRPMLEPHVKELELECADMQLALEVVGSQEELQRAAKDPETFLKVLEWPQKRARIIDAAMTVASADPKVFETLAELFYDRNPIDAVVKLALILVGCAQEVSDCEFRRYHTLLLSRGSHPTWGPPGSCNMQVSEEAAVTVLQLLSERVLCLLGGQPQDVARFVYSLPWDLVRPILRSALARQRSGPHLLAAVLRAFYGMSELRSEFEKTIKSQITRGLADRAFQEILPKGWRLQLADARQKQVIDQNGDFELTANALELLHHSIVEPLFSLVTDNVPVLVEVLTDPAALMQAALKALGKATGTCTDEKTSKVLEGFILQMVREGLSRGGVSDENNKRVVELLRLELPPDGEVPLAIFFEPQLLTQKLVAMSRRREKDRELLIQCAKAMLVHWLAQRLMQRGAGKRIVEVLREVLSAMPAERLSELLRDPEQMIQQVLREAVEMGTTFATQLLEDTISWARDAVIMRIDHLDLPPAAVEALADTLESAANEQPEQLLEVAAQVSADDIFGQLKEQLRELSATSAFAFMGFFMGQRLLPLYDMASDVLVAAEICTGSGALIELGSLFSGSCTFGGGPYAEVQRVFFVLVVIFFFLTWVVLWLALGQHMVTMWGEASDALRRQREASDDFSHPDCLAYATRGCMAAFPSIEWRVTGLFAKELDSSYKYEFFDDRFEVWNHLSLLPLLERILVCLVAPIVFLVVDLPAWVIVSFIWSIGFTFDLFKTPWTAFWSSFTRRCLWVWRGYSEPALSDESSTGSHNRWLLGCRLSVACWSLVTLPIGVPILITVEICSLLLSPGEPVRLAFSSNYENLRRVLEPALESLPQTAVQLSYLIWRQRVRGGEFDFLILSSLLASTAQLYQTYYYVAGLAKAYRKGILSIIKELLGLGSKRYVPFRLVLRKWTTVDYRAVQTRITQDWWRQISEAISDNPVLKRLRFASWQLQDASHLVELCAGLKANRALREISIFHVEKASKKGVKEEGSQVKQGEKSKKGAKEEGSQVKESEKIDLPDALIEVLSAKTGLRVVRLSGMRIEGAQWASIFQAVAAAAVLEQLHIEQHSVDHSLEKQTIVPQTDIQTLGVNALLSVRSLKHLSLSNVHDNTLSALMRGGLHRHTSIVRLDFSRSTLNPDVVRGLTAWMRGPRLRTVILDGVTVPENNIISAVKQLVAAARSTRSATEVLLLTVKDCSLAERQKQILARVCHRAMLSMRAARFVAVGLYKPDCERHSTNWLTRKSLLLWKQLRWVWNAAVPCLARRDRSVETVLLSLRRESAGKSAMQDALACLSALEASKSELLAVMLRQLPSQLTMDIQLVLHRKVLVSKRWKKADKDTEDKKRRKKADKDKEDKEDTLYPCTVLIIDSCGLVDTDISTAAGMFASRLHLAHLVLKDMPITEDGLYALWLELDCQRKTGLAIWWWHRLKHRIILRLGGFDQIYVGSGKMPSAVPDSSRIKLEFILSTCMPPRILEELIHLSHHADCSGPPGFDLCRVQSMAGYSVALCTRRLWLHRHRLPTVSTQLDKLVREIQGPLDIDLSRKGQASVQPLKGLTNPEVRWLFTLLACSLSTRWKLLDCGLATSQLQMIAAGMGGSASVTSVRAFGNSWSSGDRRG